MKLKLLVILFLITFTTFSQEEKENRIRVIGNYKEIIKANEFDLIFTFQEITSMTGGEKQIIKTIEDIKTETQNYLKDKKLGNYELKFHDFGNQNFGNKSSSYKITLKDFEFANQIIQNIKIAGISNVYIKFIFGKSDDYFNILASKALDNAKEKAEFMSNKMNKKIGRVIYIDDKSTKEPLYLESSKNKSIEQEVNYSISVTYELLDK